VTLQNDVGLLLVLAEFHRTPLVCLPDLLKGWSGTTDPKDCKSSAALSQKPL